MSVKAKASQPGVRKLRGRRKQATPISPEVYEKKQRYPFALHYDVRYEKLEDLVAFYGARSASEYLENLIVREWDKMQRKMKSKGD
ncbi:hypothetical protein [Streptococcus danieliae]|nr:hypothetical protein [Streptococcus danieliae]